MKGLYQLLSEDYRDYQLKEPIRKNASQLMESTKPSKLAKQKALKEAAEKVRARKMVKESDEVENTEEVVTEPVTENVETEAVENTEEVITESCKDDKDEIIKGSESEDDKKSIVKEDDDVEEIEPEGSDISAEEFVDEPAEEGPTALEKVSALSSVTKEEIEEAMAELSDEEKDAVKVQFEMIKNMAMELFPEEVEGEVEIEEIPEETFEECEITSFKVTRIAPKFNAFMIEAQTKDGLKYITGKNFNEAEKTLDEAEIATDKTEASNRFKSLLK